jgi:hypothetical protein
VRAYPVRPETLQELRVVLVEEWDSTDQNLITLLIQGIPRRIHTCWMFGEVTLLITETRKSWLI